MGIQMLDGRDFTERDNTSSSRVAIVDESLVAKVLHGANPIGKRIAFEFNGGHGPHMEPAWREVIGVVRHVPPLRRCQRTAVCAAVRAVRTDAGLHAAATTVDGAGRANVVASRNRSRRQSGASLPAVDRDIPTLQRSNDAAVLANRKANSSG